MFNQRNNKFNFQKVIITTLVFVMLFSSVIAPKPAQAQMFTSDIWQSVQTAFSIPFDLYDKLDKSWDKIVKSKGAVIWKQALSRVLRNIAVESANWVATGFKGQAPLFYTDPEKYIKTTSNAELGNYLNTTLKESFGVDFCKNIDPLVQLKITLGAKEYFTQNTPNCSFTDIMKNIEDIRLLKVENLHDFSKMFDPNASQLGILTNVTSIATQKKNEKKVSTADKIAQSFGWKPVETKVSKQIQTPAATVKKKAEQDLIEQKAPPEVETFTGFLLADFVGPFTSTLTSKIMQNIMKGLAKPEDYASTNLSYNSSSGFAGVSKSPVQAAKERFAELGEPNYNFGGPFDLITQLSCDNDIDSQYSCTIDEAFSSAIMELPHLTVQEALDRQLLHGDWPFGFRADKSGGTDEASKNIYSYRNLVILRKYRIIPVGWELAAQYYLKYDKSGQALTLQKLVDNYDNVNSPYYRLVDPKWVLKAPETICEKEGFGELVSEERIEYQIDLNQDGDIDDSGENISYPIRLPYCADERSCIKERSDGNGCLYYGYCTEEKPIWRIQSDNGECASVYNSCRAYTTREGQQIGYLSNTLWGQDVCDSSNVGCREYATVWDFTNDNWSDLASDRIYLNQNASDNQCSEQEAGCNRFIRLESDAIFKDDANTGSPYSYDNALTALQSGTAFDEVIDYTFSSKTSLRKAPDYLGCEGYTVDTGLTESACTTAPNFWRDDIQKCVASGNDECANYALYCSEDNVGCQFYTPTSYDGVQIPGSISENDYCPAECVGYQSYIKQPSFLEPTVPADEMFVDLIADTATTCSAVDNGCEEFTNLSEGTAGENKEYYSSIRSCILPNNPNVATYYSWTSTDEAGNQLKSWQLLESNSGGYPCTNSETASDGTVSCTDDVNSPYQCSFGNPDTNLNPVYNPDCVEFTAASGESYWMLYSRVIFTSDGCVPMRRTNGGDIYSINQEQSQKCSIQAKDCRQYKGSAANNIKIILNDDFEDGIQDWSGGTISTEALTAGGQSLYAEGNNNYITKDVTDTIKQGKSYKLSFWIRGVGAEIDWIAFWDSINNVQTDFDGFLSGSLILNDEWNYYEFNLNNLDRSISNMEYLRIEYNGDFYIDNIVLTETTDDLYLIADSWQTPASCDNPTEGAMIGCEAYQDTNNKNWYLRSFSKLCYDEVVGCEVMVDTYNNATTTSLTFNDTENSNPNDDVVVPADDLKYLVYDQQKVCTQPGCTKLGLVEANEDSTAPINYTDKYLVVDAGSFGVTVGVINGQTNPLCLVEENGCDEFVRKNGSSEYFMNPSIFTCEYKAVSGNYGWYVTGTNDICPLIMSATDGTGHCLGGRSVLNDNIDNSCQVADDCSDYARGSQPGQCSAWVGLCPIEQDNCTEYQDPANPVGCDKTSVYGEAYDANFNNGEACDFYYYQSDKVDNCDVTELGEGCQAFHQADGGANTLYSTPRCTNDLRRECEVDADCANGGKCKYSKVAAPPEYKEIYNPTPISDEATVNTGSTN